MPTDETKLAFSHKRKPNHKLNQLSAKAESALLGAGLFTVVGKLD